RFEQRLGRRCEPHALALELGERVAPRRHLCERRLGLAPCGALMRLLLLELGHAPPRLLQCGCRLGRGASEGRRLLRPRAHLGGRRPLGLRAPGTLLRRARELLPQLGPLPLERRPLERERAELGQQLADASQERARRAETEWAATAQVGARAQEAAALARAAAQAAAGLEQARRRVAELKEQETHGRAA